MRPPVKKKDFLNHSWGFRKPLCDVTLSLPLCHSRRSLAGIQGLALLSLHSGGPAWEKPVDSRLKMSGMTAGGSGGPRFPLCHSRRFPLCHSRRFLAGIHGLALLSLYSGGPVWEKSVDSRLKMSGMTAGVLKMTGMTEGLKTSGMTEGGIVGARLPFCHSRRFPLCHSRRFLAGIHGLALLSFYWGALFGKSLWTPD